MDYNEAALVFIKKIVSSNKTSIMEKLTLVSKGEIFILTYLSQQTDPVPPGELNVISQTSTARIAVILNNLENKGFITREMDKSDRRKILVTITDSGRERAKDAKNELIALVARTFQDMGETDTKEFIRTITLFFELAQKTE